MPPSNMLHAANLLSSQGVAGIKVQMSQGHSSIMLYGRREAAVLHDCLIHGHHLILIAQGFLALCNPAPQLLVIILRQLLHPFVELKGL